jgi:hypothetical protein
MSVYTLDLSKVHQTIRETLVERVLPAVGSDSARGELHAVIEMLDNLDPRLSWDAGGVAESVSRTRELAAALDVPPTTTSADLVALRADRRAIGERLAAAYAEGVAPGIVRAVAEFTTDDVNAEISRGLLPGLPG